MQDYSIKCSCKSTKTKLWKYLVFCLEELLSSGPPEYSTFNYCAWLSGRHSRATGWIWTHLIGIFLLLKQFSCDYKYSFQNLQFFLDFWSHWVRTRTKNQFALFILNMKVRQNLLKQLLSLTVFFLFFFWLVWDHYVTRMKSMIDPNYSLAHADNSSMNETHFSSSSTLNILLCI